MIAIHVARDALERRRAVLAQHPAPRGHEPDAFHFALVRGLHESTSLPPNPAAIGYVWSSVPKRTLQRRLKKENTSFEELTDLMRRELAERYLRERRLGRTIWRPGPSQSRRDRPRSFAWKGPVILLVSIRVRKSA
jgi:hypothetical protein